MNFFWIPMLLLFIQPPIHADTLTVTEEGRTLSTVKHADFVSNLPGTELIETSTYVRFVDKLDHLIYQAPKNAKISEDGNIDSEQSGQRLHRKVFQELFYTYFYSKEFSTMEIPKLAIAPKVSADLLTQIRVQLIGHYVTYYNRHNIERSHNISLAAKAIDSHVVFPGEKFSFNRVVGKRTAERGYLPAPIIVKGELSEGIGGGICQVSSTLYNAADRAGVQIIERYSHSKRVPYVLPGRDATVSWYGPDFTFKNKYDEPILIRAKAENGRMYITIFSSDEITYKPRVVPSMHWSIQNEVYSEW
jgi:vancomycin resistance protein YoaR